MRILDRLPIYQNPDLIDVRGDIVQVWATQTIVWVGLSETSRPFPAILDTGHSHNLSIARRHLAKWAGVELERVGEAKIGGHTVPLYRSGLFLIRNVPGTTRLRRDRTALRMPGGVAVVPDDLPISPRLPLLGLKAILENRLRLLIDGRRRDVTLKTAGWF